MLAITFHGVKSIICEQIADPGLESPEDVIVRVELAGVCGSDMHIYFGREGGLDTGTVMGHEFVGEVVAVGEAVRTLKTGDWVIAPFTTNCGNCFYCRLGLTSRCERGQLFGWVENGTGLHGGQAQFVRVPLAETTLMPMPDDIAPEEALLLGDVLPTGLFGALNAGVAAKGIFAVIGCGPVGLMAVVASRALGAETILAVDAIPERLALAEAFGAEPLNLNSDDIAGTVMQLTTGRGVDAVIEAVGSAEAMQLAFTLLRPGGTLSVVGVHNESQFAITPEQAYDKNLTYKTGRCPARYLMPQALEMLRHRQGDVKQIVSHHLPLTQGPEGYMIFAERRDGCTKVVLAPWM